MVASLLELSESAVTLSFDVMGDGNKDYTLRIVHETPPMRSPTSSPK
jgi:hypothetical protein